MKHFSCRLSGQYQGRPVVFGLCLLGACMLAGCTKREEGPARYLLSGQVTFDGKPVAVGTISFSPDSARGNSGPGTSTQIKEGLYRTNPQKGIIGGPMIVEITGSDGVPVMIGGERIEAGTMLFKAYRVEIDLPEENTEQNFIVPAGKET